MLTMAKEKSADNGPVSQTFLAHSYPSKRPVYPANNDIWLPVAATISGRLEDRSSFQKRAKGSIKGEVCYPSFSGICVELV
jgi:hypothetical protein